MKRQTITTSLIKLSKEFDAQLLSILTKELTILKESRKQINKRDEVGLLVA